MSFERFHPVGVSRVENQESGYGGLALGSTEQDAKRFSSYFSKKPDYFIRTGRKKES